MKPLILENERVKLELLSTLNYKLLEPIAKEKDLIYYSPSDISTPKKLENYVLKAIKQFEEKTAIPFIIYDKQLNSYAGSTRFGHINWVNKTLHIGWTWIGYKFQGTGLNNNIKTLMLNYAFDTLNFKKVEFRVDERNIKSRKAVEKLNAKLDCILIKDTIMTDGFIRNTCCYSLQKQD